MLMPYGSTSALSDCCNSVRSARTKSLTSSVVTPGDYPYQVALGNGGIYFAGQTTNPNFPITPGAYKTTCCPAGGFGIREADNFAGRLSSDLSTLEALTFAWLAQRRIQGKPGNLPSVTGAGAAVVLGGLYPAPEH